ncbi:hypothetical protein GOP47_0030123 [Adiantum capillus-veneris]|nr:hypothetical protein GOP47_0030123 [Adiantum capillus-veneris]
MLDGQGCLLPVRHFHSDNSPVMISSLSGLYPTCCAEASAETNPNSNTNPLALQSPEALSWSLVAEVDRESNQGELLDFNISRSCIASPLPFEEADTTQACPNIGVVAEKGAISSIFSDFNCSSTSPSRSALVFHSSPMQVVEAGPAQAGSSYVEIEGVVSRHCLLAEVESRSSDFTRSVQEEGGSIKVIGGDEMPMEFAEAASSSVIQRDACLSRSVGDGSQIGGALITASLGNCDQVCSDGTERSSGAAHAGILQDVNKDLDSKEELLEFVCASKNCMDSKETQEASLETANAEKVLTKHSSRALLARHGWRSPCRDANGCKKMRVIKCIETSYESLSTGASTSAKRETTSSSANDEQQDYLPGRKYRDLVKSRFILELRRTYGMVEHLVFTYASGPENWTAYDANRKSLTLYITGGFGPANNSGALTLLRSAEKYNSVTGQWELLPPMSTPRHKCAGFFMDGNFYVIGGRDANHQPIMSGEEYNPSTGVWRTIPNMYFAPAVHHFRNGWGVAFKGLGDRLFVLGDQEGIAAFCWQPGPNTSVPDWQLLSHRERGVDSFLYNCHRRDVHLTDSCLERTQLSQAHLLHSTRTCTHGRLCESSTQLMMAFNATFDDVLKREEDSGNTNTCGKVFEWKVSAVMGDFVGIHKYWLQSVVQSCNLVDGQLQKIGCVEKVTMTSTTTPYPFIAEKLLEMDQLHRHYPYTSLIPPSHASLMDDYVSTFTLFPIPNPGDNQGPNTLLH